MFAFQARYILNTVEFILSLYVCIQHWHLCIRKKGYVSTYGMFFLSEWFIGLYYTPVYVPFWVSHYTEWVFYCFIIVVCWNGWPWRHITRQIGGNERGYKDVIFALNTILTVRTTTRPAFILHPLKSQWTSTRRRPPNISCNNNNRGGLI